jgi:hypothetical protein
MPIRASDLGAAQRENPAFAKFSYHVDSMTKFLLRVYAVSVNATNMRRTDSICRGKS